MEKREYIGDYKRCPYIVYYTNRCGHLVKSKFEKEEYLKKYIENNIDNMKIDAVYIKGKLVYPKVTFEKVITFVKY